MCDEIYILLPPEVLMEELYMYNVVTQIQTWRLYAIIMHFTHTLNGKCNFFKTAIMLQYKE